MSSGSRSRRNIQPKNYEEPSDPEMSAEERLAEQFKEEDQDDQDENYPSAGGEDSDNDEEDEFEVFSSKPRKQKKTKVLPPPKQITTFRPPFMAAGSAKAKKSSARSSCMPSTRETAPSNLETNPSDQERSHSYHQERSPSYHERSPSYQEGSPLNWDRLLNPSSHRNSTSPNGRRSPSPNSPQKKSSCVRKSPRIHRGPPLTYSPSSRTIQSLTTPSTTTPTSSGVERKKRKRSAKELQESGDWCIIVQEVIKKMKALKQPLKSIGIKKVYDELLEGGVITAVGWSPAAVKDKARNTKLKVSHE